MMKKLHLGILVCVIAFVGFGLSACGGSSSASQTYEITGVSITIMCDDEIIQDGAIIDYNESKVYYVQVDGARDGDIITYTSVNQADAFHDAQPYVHHAGEHTFYVKIQRQGFETLILDASITITMMEYPDDYLPSFLTEKYEFLVMSPLGAKVGTLTLPLHYSWQNPNALVEQGGEYVIALQHNPNYSPKYITISLIVDVIE